MQIRTATWDDLEAISAVEAACFPAAEAASGEDFAARLKVYPQYFWLLEDEDGTLVSFINGMVTDEMTIRDEQYADASFHNAQGAWQTVFGVNTLPQYRKQGLAAQVMERVIADARSQGRKGCILTCKDALIHYYEKFGYRNYGLSASQHGGAVWYDMRLEF